MCGSPNPRNRRTRSSIAVEEGGTRLLVDALPDLRTQLLANGMSGFDAVLLTHAHGTGASLGLRFGPIAYSTDVSALSMAALDGVAVWIVDCLRSGRFACGWHRAGLRRDVGGLASIVVAGNCQAV